jgi:hypothetical protein
MYVVLQLSVLVCRLQGYETVLHVGAKSQRNQVIVVLQVEDLQQQLAKSRAACSDMLSLGSLLDRERIHKARLQADLSAARIDRYDACRPDFSLVPSTLALCHIVSNCGWHRSVVAGYSST